MRQIKTKPLQKNMTLISLCSSRNHATGYKSQIHLLRNLKITNMDSPDEKKFFPKGAIAFFIALVILTLVFFYSIYYLMIERS